MIGRMNFPENLSSERIGEDGDQIAQHMIDNNVGVTPVQDYKVKRIDSDYITDY